jgi:cytochrome P450
MTAASPEEAHEMITRARRQAPIGLGPHGPEVLTYELVRAVLRDQRFRMPPGFTLAAQGITSGPVWDRSISTLLGLDGAGHRRLRRLVSGVFTPRAAARLLGTIVDIITELVDPLTEIGSCDIVADVATQYPIPIICALIGAPRQDWQLFSGWADDIIKAFCWNVANDTPDIVRAWNELDDYIDDMVAARRTTLTDDLLSDLADADGGAADRRNRHHPKPIGRLGVGAVPASRQARWS